MSRATVIITTEADRRVATHWVSKAPVGTTITFKRSARSIDQNNLMWARLTDIAQQVDWYGQKLTADDWKDIFTASLRRARVVPGIDAGTYVPLGMRTSDMTKEEFSNLLELMAAFAAERGVTFSDQAVAA
jgi:hypothetical protein